VFYNFIKDIKPKTAGTRQKTIHTIAELVYHITTWRIFALKKIQGDVEFEIKTEKQNWGNITFIIKSNRNIDFYFNGIYKGSVSTTNTLFIINRIASGFTGGIFYYPLQGSISATKIYNRSLSSTEVLQNFNSLKSRFGL
jgi:hypothetical protein